MGTRPSVALDISIVEELPADECDFEAITAEEGMLEQPATADKFDVAETAGRFRTRGEAPG